LLDTDGAVCFEQVHPIERSEPTELASRVASKLIGADVPWAFFGPCDAGRYPYADLLPDDPVRPWFDRPDAERHIDKLIENRHVTTTEAQLLRDFIRDGFMVIENAVDPSLIAAVNAEIDHAIAKGWNGYTYGSSQRIELLHLSYPNIKRLWLDPAHRRWANLLFGTVARPCQTLTYVFGSQQAEHQDTIHLTTFPPGYMCGAWIALQDVVPHSGELVYYPGSHRERRIYLSELGVGKTLTPPDWQPFEDKALPAWREIAARYPRQIYRPRAGTIAIWHENLLHGGSERDDRRLERRSVVVHSYAEGALAFADSSGITCTAATLGELQVEP
jgi:ectoine hydroxylase-related dioxygenase (phytanoyl-CoA dioxygenase family)